MPIEEKEAVKPEVTALCSADRAQLAGIEASTAMFLVSVIGIGNTIGRVVCGLASSLPGVNALVINNVFISTGGLLTIFSGLSLAKGYQFFYAAGFGLSICKYVAVNPVGSHLILVVRSLQYIKVYKKTNSLLICFGIEVSNFWPFYAADAE